MADRCNHQIAGKETRRMRRYLIMLSALFVAIIVMTLIKSWQRRRALARGF